MYIYYDLPASELAISISKMIEVLSPCPSILGGLHAMSNQQATDWRFK